VTALENRMAREDARRRFAPRRFGSFVAGTLGTAHAFLPRRSRPGPTGPAEYFALIVLGFTTISAVLGDTLARGLLSLFFGLALGLVGIDLQTGQARYTLGSPQLLDWIDVVVVAVGLFAVGETLFQASKGSAREAVTPVSGFTWMSREDLARSWKPWLRGTLLGFPIGGLPAGGAEIPTFLSYALERRLSSRPRSSAEAPSKASPARRPRITRRSRDCSFLCSRSGFRPRRPPPCCWPPSSSSTFSRDL
jgi:putative tricarboxylic transport membrane protein